MSVSLRASIEDFLSYRRLAMAGVSRDPRDFSRTLYRELKQRGYDMQPVNPLADEVEGDRCYAHIPDIAPKVDGVIVMTSPEVTEAVVKECAAAGVRRVWMFRAAGHGAVSPEAVRFCEANGIEAIAGECPFMFLAGAGWVHDVHRFCRRMLGTFPQ
jgi:predicted CoA-binding protein